MRTFLSLVFVAVMCACGAALPDADDPELKDVRDKLGKCRTEARAAHQADASAQDSYAQYSACKKDAGL